ncbi:hypothetical protein [Phenylobacterium sp. CCH9-H3]|uniref:hypothetical protein n=1 Tax=Phenylobacterium sp. CCH9-H3 TaxID=1768774 RepID=UPI00083B7B96|nr:hypothetical protein [Phenylobacterium sp. CCH9-H3]
MFAMPERRTVKLERLCIEGPGRDRWFLRPGRRQGKRLWFDPDQAPFADADAAWSEVERVPGGRRVLRRVENRP